MCEGCVCGAACYSDERGVGGGGVEGGLCWRAMGGGGGGGVSSCSMLHIDPALSGVFLPDR